METSGQDDHRAPSWRFAPTGGGAEQGNNPGQAYFANDAVAQMVRETLQNSLDHPEPGLDTVAVTFRLIDIDPGDIRADQLAPHIRASLQEARSGGDPDSTARYEEMERAIAKRRIPCLAVIDENTTGLQGENWRNLIIREGAPANTGGQAKGGQTKGGSFGFGKNAPFNLSACGAVLYSTRYVSQARKGRVCHAMARSQLMTHWDPDDENVRLQSAGFLAMHQDGPGPVAGPDIPAAFQLEHSGTGVFIIGFDEERCPDWPERMGRTVVSQFLLAVHHGKLSVRIEPGGGQPARQIDRLTLDTELEALDERDPARHYHRAIMSKPELTEPSGRLRQMGTLRVWIDTSSRDAPRRVAHFNRRGMLITDSRQTSENPFHATGGTGWQPWCAVTTADDEGTDRQLRRMEPPAHDAIHPGQLRDPAERQEMEGELRRHREQIIAFVKGRIDDRNRMDTTNIEELAGLFPDLPDLGEGTEIEWRETAHREDAGQSLEIDVDDDDETGAETYGEADGEAGAEDEGREQGLSGDPADNDGGTGTGGAGNRTQGPPPLALREGRIIRTGPRELAMTFLMPAGGPETVRFGVRAAGEQYQQNEETVPVSGVREVGDMLAGARLENGQIAVTAPPNTRVTLEITLGEPDGGYRSYRLHHAGRREGGK